ncbi:MAG: MFS transporter [Bacillota bacterium]|nr:MFS transporter [Bacillota bacterium]
MAVHEPKTEKRVFDNVLVQKVLSYRYFIFVLIAIPYFLVYFHRTSTAVVAKALVDAFNVTPAALGLLGSMYFYPYAAGQLPAGILADNWGPKKTVSLFLLIAAIGAIVFGAAPSFAVTVVGRFLVGLGVGFVYVPAMRLLADWFRRQEFATMSGIMLAIGNLGSLSSAGPLALMMVAIGWRNSFHVIGAVTFLAVILFFLFMVNKPQDKGWPSIQEIEGTVPAAGQSVKKYGVGESLKMIFSNWEFNKIGILLFFFYGGMMGFQGLWAGPWLRHVYGMEPTQAANYLMLMAVGLVFGCPLSGILSDKVLKSRKKVLLYGGFLYTLSYIPIVLKIDSLSPVMIAVLFFYWGLTAGSFVVCFANSKECFPVELAGTSTGSVNLYIFVGGAIHQQVMGLIIQRYPAIDGVYPAAAYQTAFGFLIAGMALALLLYSTFKEKPQF